MNTATWSLAAVGAALMLLAFVRGRHLPLAGLKTAAVTLWTNLPLILLGFLVAGLAQVLVPKEWIGRWLGAASGIRGVLLGCLAGGLVPGSPYAVYPIVAGILKAGASPGSVVGFLCAWSLWSVTRLPLEMALIDPRLALTRYAVTFVIPPIAGVAADSLYRWLK